MSSSNESAYIPPHLRNEKRSSSPPLRTLDDLAQHKNCVDHLIDILRLPTVDDVLSWGKFPADVVQSIEEFIDFTCPQQRQQLVEKVDKDQDLMKNNHGRLGQAYPNAFRHSTSRNLYMRKYCHYHAENAIERAVVLSAEGKDYDKSELSRKCLLSVFMCFAVQRNINACRGTTQIPEPALINMMIAHAVLALSRSIIRDILIQTRMNDFSCFQNLVHDVVDIMMKLKSLEVPRGDGFQTVGSILDEMNYQIDLNGVLCYCIISCLNGRLQSTVTEFFEEERKEDNMFLLSSFFKTLALWFSEMGQPVEIPTSDQLRSCLRSKKPLVLEFISFLTNE
ncbi:hypothetical protein P9112_008120 [Eukaryota sp. TZLM1-RC]